MFAEPLYNEKELLLLVSRGDELAFTELFHQYQNRIYSIAYKLSDSPLMAEEIVQDVLLTIWLRRADLHRIQHFTAYLYKIVQNKIYKSLQRMAKNYRHQPGSFNELTAAGNDPESYTLEKQYESVLHEGIEKLPQQQKQVYQLIREKGMKRAEVALLLKLQPETVKFHLSKAVKNLWNYCQLHLHLFMAFVISWLLRG